jgi:superfamily II DNA or RNA helicase
VLILAHRDELLRQAKEKLLATTDLNVLEIGLEKCDSQASPGHRVVIASKDSMHKNRLKRFGPGEFTHIITDEAHRACADGYQAIYDHFPEAKHLGCTATPSRLDKRALGQVFETVAYRYDLADAVRDGWLVRIKRKLIHLQSLDLSDIKSSVSHAGGRDLNEHELAKVMEQDANVWGVAKATLHSIGERPTLAFAVRVHKDTEAKDRKGHLYQLVEAFNHLRPGCAAGLDGDSDHRERTEVQKRFREGKIQILVNVGLFTEGWDEDCVAAVAMARPTESWSFYLQALGRGTRLKLQSHGYVDGADAYAESVANGKPDLLVLDFEGNSGKHDLISAENALGGLLDEDLAKQVRRRPEIDGELEVVPPAEEEGMTAEERAAAANGLAVTFRSVTVLDPWEILGVAPRTTTREGLTAGQLYELQAEGIRDARRLDRPAAELVLTALRRRRGAGLCSLRQATILARAGLNPHVSKVKAYRAISELEAMKWRPTARMLADPELAQAAEGAEVETVTVR